MDADVVPPKATPTRRRNGRNHGRPSSQKAYASENDAVSVNNYHSSAGIQTPEKDKRPSGSPAQANRSTKQLAAKQRGKHQVYQRNHSPELSRPDQHLTPERSASAKLRADKAFAGATFHASPAPSALPMPSFFANSPGEDAVTTYPEPNTQQTTQQPSPPATDTDLPTPSRSLPPRSRDSPLDFMFRAHRQELQRERQGGASDQDSTSIGRASPHSPLRSPGKHEEARFRPSPARHFSGSGIEQGELDGFSGRAMGPAFSTPYHDRIRAAQSNPGRHGPPSDGVAPQLQPDSSDDPTRALKKFLFSGNGSVRPTPPSGFSSHSNSREPGGQMVTAAPGADSSAQEPNNIAAMEDNLRRILKMDTSSGRP